MWQRMPRKSEVENGRIQKEVWWKIQEKRSETILYNSSTVKDLAEDLGINEKLLYSWRRKYTADGGKTKYATLEEENRDLKVSLPRPK